MAQTMSKPEIAIREEVNKDFVKRERKFLFWTTEWWEHVNTQHIANDLIIRTDRKIRAIWINDKEITL